MSGIFAIVTSQAEYAVSAMVELAATAGGGSIRSPEIARRLDVPAASLEQVMVRLRRHGLVRSFRGAAGGYALARPADEITVSEVLAVFLSTRGAERPGAPEVAIRQVVREEIDHLEAGLAAHAARLTIGALAARCQERNDAMAVMPGL